VVRDGLMAEFSTADGMIAALRTLRGWGYSELDAFTPYPLEEAERLVQPRRSRLPYVVLGFGLLGAGGAYFLQWYFSAVLYPLNVGGRPPHMPLAFVPITFEMGVLLAGVAAFLGVLGFGKLVRLWDPVFEVGGFERASDDRFWVLVDGRDSHFDLIDTRADLERVGALTVARLPGWGG
jgi:hypothetical protein